MPELPAPGAFKLQSMADIDLNGGRLHVGICKSSGVFTLEPVVGARPVVE